MSDVSDMASSDGHPSRGVTPSAPKQQETPSIGCACPTSRTWPPSTAVAQRWGNGPLIAFKHRIQASHSSIAFKYRIQLSHSQISDTTDAALFRGDQRPTGGCAIRRPLQSPQMIIGPVKGGGCGRGGGLNIQGCRLGSSPAQIRGTEEEPQQIVAQRLLSCLQYHVP